MSPGSFFFVACLAASAPAPDPPDPTAAALVEARALLDAGKPAAALMRLQGLDPKNPRVAYLQGVAYYRGDDPVRAIDRLSPVVEALPADSMERREAVQVLGLSLYLAGRLPESIPFLEQTRVWAADNGELLYVLANSYIQTRRADPAREALARLYRVPPDSAAAHLLAGQMMVRLEFEDMAERELKTALAKDPRIPEARYLLAQASIFRARFDEAVDLLQKELEINPTNAMALYRLGDALTRQNKWEEATQALQKSLWLNPYFSGPYILLGRAYTKKGQPEVAEGMLRRAIGYDPNNKSAHYLLGQLLQQVGRAEEARRELDVAERLQGEKEPR